MLVPCFLSQAEENINRCLIEDKRLGKIKNNPECYTLYQFGLKLELLVALWFPAMFIL